MASAVDVFMKVVLSAELIIRPFMLDFKLLIFSPFGFVKFRLQTVDFYSARDIGLLLFYIRINFN